ncbi:MAG: hypothetical protein ACLQU1_04815 [Bryobacteraceae bacterium]
MHRQGRLRLYQQRFVLNASFSGQSLTGISITDTSGPDTLLLGITAIHTESSTPEPSTFGLLGIAVQSGRLELAGRCG